MSTTSSRRALALVVAGSLASSACTPVAIGSAVVGGGTLLGGLWMMQTDTDCEDHPYDRDSCLQSGFGILLLLLLLGLVVGAPGAAYLYFE